jgi:hypothetical protein
MSLYNNSRDATPWFGLGRIGWMVLDKKGQISGLFSSLFLHCFALVLHLIWLFFWWFACIDQAWGYLLELGNFF